MKYFDIIEHPNTAWGLWDEWKNRFTARQIAASPFSTKIPVQGLTMCWYCRKDFMAPPFTVYCSPKCQDGGENLEDNWRQE